jgi:hypothetical protein
VKSARADEIPCGYEIGSPPMGGFFSSMRSMDFITQ